MPNVRLAAPCPPGGDTICLCCPRLLLAFFMRAHQSGVSAFPETHPSPVSLQDIRFTNWEEEASGFYKCASLGCFQW